MRISDWSSDVCSSDLRDILRALDLENRGRRLAVVIQFRIGEIGEDPDLILARPGDQPLVESKIDRPGGGVGRIFEDDHAGARHGEVLCAPGVLELLGIESTHVGTTYTMAHLESILRFTKKNTYYNYKPKKSTIP